ncbi:C-X-C motif chemokine 10-like [Crotalus adamanteus]|uniref:C-X-C motif chemokine 10-like n=1 Tax=Crotalus adamanteus TaxID=8729 RepID=A0AAW1B902_CROAD
MMKVCVASFSLLLLLAVGLEGMVTIPRNTCKCQTVSPRPMRLGFVSKLEIFPISSSCNKVEYIATRKITGQQQCLDPTSKEVQKMLKNFTNLKNTQPGRRRPIRPQ